MLYTAAEIAGALLGSLSVKYVVGRGIQASLGFNLPNYSYPLPSIFEVEVLDCFADDGNHFPNSHHAMA